MKSEDFKISPTGRVVRTLDGHPAFIPNPLPPEFETGRIINQLAKAQQQLGALSEVGRSLPNPYLFFRPMMSQEAVSSSAMEGTVTTLTNLFAYEAAARGSAADIETREVHNYVRALQYAADTLNKLPISKRLLCDTHEVLRARVSRVRGRQKRPGEFRGPGDNAWTGPTERIEDARFVFVPGEQVLEAFGALEQYIADIEKPGNLPVLVKVALVHYQFETIHPFFDGNGRLGRLMIPLLLYQLRVLPHPMLYLSSYFQRNKNSYIDYLYEVTGLHLTRSGDHRPVGRFFALAPDWPPQRLNQMVKVQDFAATITELFSVNMGETDGRPIATLLPEISATNAP